MKILTVCDQGNNRSVMFAHLLKYWGNECIPIWIKTNSLETIHMLYDWADSVILTEFSQKAFFENWFNLNKIHVLEVWPDTYPRPFNKDLHEKIKLLLEENKLLFKN